ncbi:hypothetical protein [Brachyspira pulli]|uniref:hypothetical protein n=1 Tax=Brachyspira pulli TaxID=310721 RepID=UPI003005C403
MNNKENRLHTSISLSNEEFKKLSEIIVDLNLKNNNQLVSYIVRDYIKKYTSDTPPASELSAFSHSDNQNNSIDDLKNSINNLNQSINILIERLPDKNN